MKRAVVEVPQGPLEIGTLPFIPTPPENGAIVKTQYCGICHSDIHLWQRGAVACPSVYGHEVSGKLYSFGPKADSKGLEIGDNVLVYSWLGCGNCNECEDNKDNLCKERFHEIGCGADGGYANFVSVRHTKFLIKVPDSIPMDVACLLPCSGVTSYSAMKKLKPYIDENKRNTNVLIIGAGGLGLWCLQWAKICLPERAKITCADIHMDKLDLALQHGADEVFCWSRDSESNDDVIKELIDRSNGGFDGVLDFVNSSVTSERAFSSLKQNGTHVMVGLYFGTLTIPLRPMVTSMKRIFGSFVGSLQELHELVELVTSTKVKPPPIIHYKLEDINEAWEALKDGKMPGRGVIKY